jgi:hypothetical protein
VDGGRRWRIQPHGQAATAVGEWEDQDRGEAKVARDARDQSDGLTERQTYTEREAVESWLEHGLTGRDDHTVTNRTILAKTHVIPALGNAD